MCYTRKRAADVRVCVRVQARDFGTGILAAGVRQGLFANPRNDLSCVRTPGVERSRTP